MTGVLEFVVITFILYWFFGTRASAMVDIVSNCAQAVYSKMDRTPEPPPPRPSRPSRNFRQKESVKNKYLSFLEEMRDRQFFRSKEHYWSAIKFKKTRPVMGAYCASCLPQNKERLSMSTDLRSVQNILETEAERDKSLLVRTFCHLAQNYRLKKFNYPQVAGSVLIDSRLRQAIETTAQSISQSVPDEEKTVNLYDHILASQEARAKRILLEMRSTISDFLLRVTSWILYKLLPRFLTSVCLHPMQLEMLQKAARSNLPLIFVPLHRSHLDYILITFILLNTNVKSPLVAAGNNLKIPVFGWLLRGLGAFFIKRRIDPAAGRKDVLYRAVLHTYMMQCLEAGHNIEFYIEGGRTRTGKPCMPKGGLLSVIIDAYMAGKVQDALLVPVSVNYDKLVDGNFIRELLGQPKQMETFSSAMSAIWTTLNSNYGSMRIDFNQPFSLKEFVKSFQTMNKFKKQSSSDFGSVESSPTTNGCTGEKVFRSIPSTTSLYGTDVVDEDHRVLVDSIARHLIYDCAKACAAMSTNILAFLLLNKYRNGVEIQELAISFDKLREQILSEKRDLGFSGDSIDVINYAVELLGPSLVTRQVKELKSGITCEIITPVTVLPNVIELSYYSNSLLSHFMVDAVVATAIKVTSKIIHLHGDTYITLTEDTVIHCGLELCDILQFEFIFSKPCQSLESVISEAFEKFNLMELIFSVQGSQLQWVKMNRKFSPAYDSEDEDSNHRHLPLKYIVNTASEETEMMELFTMMLRPLIDAYVVTASCLPSLLSRQVQENEFVKEVLSEIQTQLKNGTCLYGESSSSELIKNACKLFKTWGVIEMISKDSNRVLYLTDEYSNPDMLKNIKDKIEVFKHK